MRPFCFAVFLLFATCALAQQGLSPNEGAKSLAMGGASIANDDVTALFNNQAGLVHIDSIMAYTVQANRRFNLAALTAVSAGVAAKTKFGHTGLMVSSYGFESLSEQKIGLAYARKLTDIIALGAQFDFIQFRIEEYGSQISSTFEVGLYSELSDQVHLSAHVFSPAKIAITEEYSIDSRLRIGLKYLPSHRISLQTEIDKTLDLSPTIRVGMEYKLNNQLMLRSGVSTNPTSYSAGFGYAVANQFVINAAYAFHQQLGYTPGIGIIWNN